MAQVLEIVQRVLGVEEIGPHADFFDLGGSSLAAVHVTHLIQSQLGVPVSLTDFFDAVDLHEFAGQVADRMISRA